MGDFVYDLDLPPGLNSDETAYGGKGHWQDGSNVRFRNGRPEAIGRMIKIAGGATAASPRSMFAYSPSASTSPIIIIGCDAALKRAGLTGVADISPTGLGSGISYWAFDGWGDALLASPKGGKLYEYTGSGIATEVTEAPDQINHMLVTAQRQVMALGTNEVVSDTQNPMCIRLSDIEDYASAGSWAPTSTNNADEIILEGPGKIVAGRRVGQGVAVWTNGMLFYGQFIGDPGQSYRFDPISDGCGLIGPGGVAELGGIVHWMSPDHRFFRWSPGMLPAQIPCPIGIDLQTNINGGALRLDQRTIAVENAAFNEVWWFYPDTRESATGGYRYVAFNVADGTWFKGQLDRRAAYHADFLYNPGSSSTFRGWRPLISADGDGYIYSHEVEAFGGGGDGVAPFDSYIQTSDQYLDSGRLRVRVKGFRQDFETLGYPVDLTLYFRNYPQSAPVTKGPFYLTAEGSGFQVSSAVASGDSSFLVAAGTGSIAAGRQVTLAGVNGWENGADSGSLRIFTVATNLPSTGTLQLTEALVSSGAGRNVANLPAIGAAVTVLGTAARRSIHGSGMLMSVKFSSAIGSNGGQWRLGKPSFDCSTMGGR